MTASNLAYQNSSVLSVLYKLSQNFTNWSYRFHRLSMCIIIENTAEVLRGNFDYLRDLFSDHT